MTQSSLRDYGVTGDEKYIIVMEEIPYEEVPDEFMDVHAGGSETSLMLDYYPNLVRREVMKKLESTRTTKSDFEIWRKGGEFTRTITPQGYCGDPQNVDQKKARDLDELVENMIVKVIHKFCR